MEYREKNYDKKNQSNENQTIQEQPLVYSRGDYWCIISYR